MSRLEVTVMALRAKALARSRGGTVFTLIADPLAVTLNMAECAVRLFEAASRAPGGARPDGSYVPERS